MILLAPSGKKYRLAHCFEYKDIVVPEGYETDGISYKLRIIALLVNKFDPRYITAVVVHDWLCDQEEYEKADKYFEELLPKGTLSKVMVASVKIYHKVRYGV